MFRIYLDIQELSGPHINVPTSAEEDSSETVPESDTRSTDAETVTES